MQLHVGQCGADVREHVVREPQHRVHIRRMAEAADEQQVPALRPCRAIRAKLVQVGQHAHRRLRRVLCQQLAFRLAHDQRCVGVRDQAEFARARAQGGAQCDGIARQCCGAAFAQVVQVDGVEQQLRAWCVPAQQRQEFGGDVMSADHHRIEARAVFAQPGRNSRHVRCMPALHAKLLQRCGVRAIGAAVGGQEHHVRAFGDQQAHQVHQPQ